MTKKGRETMALITTQNVVLRIVWWQTADIETQIHSQRRQWGVFVCAKSGLMWMFIVFTCEVVEAFHLQLIYFNFVL